MTHSPKGTTAHEAVVNLTPATPAPDGDVPAQADNQDIDPDSVDDGPGKGPRMRRCVATGERRAPSGMVRFAVSPEGKVTPDVAGRLPGRGAWTTASREAVDAAIARKAFSRAFRRPVEAPENLADIVCDLLTRRSLDLLGFAKRSGDLILGFDQVREELRRARPGCLIEAADGASDGRSKVLGLFRGLYGSEAPTGAPTVIGCFLASELGMALGRDHVVHAVVKHGRIAKNLLAELERLGGFRPLTPGDWASAEEGSSSGD